MRRTTISAAVAVLACTLAACSSSETTTVSKATDTPATSPTPTPSASPSPDETTFRVGETANVTDPEGTFTAGALTYRDTGITTDVPDLLKDGQKWALVEVKFCNKGTEVMSVSPFPWTLAYEDGARVEATHMSGAGLPEPLYPMDAKVKAGDCVRGNVTFQVPEQGRAERVLYSPEVLDEPLEWTIPKG